MTTDFSIELKRKVDQSVEILKQALADYGSVTFANSLGAEDVVITDLIAKHAPGITPFSIDTGRLPNETLELLARIEQRYQQKIAVYYPDFAELERFVGKEGINAFYDSQTLRKACCSLRKVVPLKRALVGYGAWVTGLRREQSITRNELSTSTWDSDNGLQKINPLADWSVDDLWSYIHTYQLPYNALHDHGYPSIGCAPCTRAISTGEDIRAGRWWWEQPETKECGLHNAPQVILRS